MHILLMYFELPLSDNTSGISLPRPVIFRTISGSVLLPVVLPIVVLLAVVLLTVVLLSVVNEDAVVVASSTIPEEVGSSKYKLMTSL